jgi:uncharacterized membrane protein
MRPEVLLAFLAMGAVSYAIRLAGFFAGGTLHRYPRLRAAIDQLPAAILLALVAPQLAHGGTPERLASLVVIAAACYVDLLLVPLALGVVAVVLLRATISG